MRLSDKQEKQVVADYAELGSYNKVGKLHGISHHTVKAIVNRRKEFSKICQQKKEANSQSVLEHMGEIVPQVNAILDSCMDRLPDKIDAARATEIATVMGILIDKFSATNKVEKDNKIEVVIRREKNED